MLRCGVTAVRLEAREMRLFYCGVVFERFLAKPLNNRRNGHKIFLRLNQAGQSGLS